MRRKRSHKRIYFVLFVVAFSLVRGIYSVHQSIANTGDVPDEVIVKFKEEKVDLDKPSGIKEAEATAKEKSLTVEEHIEESNISVFDTNNKPLSTVVSELKKDPDVAVVEPNYERELILLPDDQFFEKLWGFRNTGQVVNGTTGVADADIHMPDAYKIEAMSQSEVVVAVLDSGVSYTHPDISSNMWSASSCLDENNNPIPGGCPNHGWDFYNEDNDPADDNSHGTHVAGTIAAASDNGVGVSGMSVRNKIKIMSVKFLGRSGSGTIADEIRAINYAKNNGAHVINASFGGDSYSTLEKEAIDSFPGIFVAAAGNENTNNDTTPGYPCSYTSTNIICVAATNQSDTLASFSNFGTTSVDVAAPGANIYSLNRDSGYTYKSGTSMATPHVAGLSALVWGANRSLSSSEVKNAVLSSGDALSALSGKVATGRRINARQALQAIDRIPGVTAVSGISGQYKLGQEIVLSVQFTKPVVASGGTRLLLNTGDTDRYASYTSGSGTNMLTFSYTVQSGDNTGDLDYISSGALDAGGGYIKDLNGTSAALLLSEPNSTGSLGKTTAIIIDTTPPVVASAAFSPPQVAQNSTTSLIATITDSNKAAMTKDMITADFTSLGLTGNVNATSYDSATGIAVWQNVTPVVSPTTATVPIRMIDAAGNISESHPVQLTVNPQAVVIPVAAAPQSSGSSGGGGGGGGGGGSSGGGGGGGGAPSAPSCGNQAPQNPRFLTARSLGNGRVSLSWRKPLSGKITHYFAFYGQSRGSTESVNGNIGGPRATYAVISGLTGGKTYYFRIGAANGCAFSGHSNEVAVRVPVYRVAAAKTYRAPQTTVKKKSVAKTPLSTSRRTR